ncbi:hypothetical protein QJQ45_011522 [Haematococcus lacustris]|nr:hypothetical protein QJQ45_011522 [Haematococcus lacustris]
MQSADDMSSGEEVQLKGESCSGAGSLSRKGNWRGISRYFVQSRTPTQVASHAQKHFLRIGSGASKRRSRFTAIEEEVRAAPADFRALRAFAHGVSAPFVLSQALSTPAPQQQQQQQQPLSPAIPMLAKRAQHSTFHLHHPMNGGVSRTSPTSSPAQPHPHSKPSSHAAQLTAALPLPTSHAAQPLVHRDSMCQFAASQPGVLQAPPPYSLAATHQLLGPHQGQPHLSQPVSSGSSASEAGSLPGAPQGHLLPPPPLHATGLPCFMPHLLFSFPHPAPPPSFGAQPLMYPGGGVPPLMPGQLSSGLGQGMAVMGMPVAELPPVPPLIVQAGSGGGQAAPPASLQPPYLSAHQPQGQGQHGQPGQQQYSGLEQQGVAQQQQQQQQRDHHHQLLLDGLQQQHWQNQQQLQCGEQQLWQQQQHSEQQQQQQQQLALSHHQLLFKSLQQQQQHQLEQQQYHLHLYGQHLDQQLQQQYHHQQQQQQQQQQHYLHQQQQQHQQQVKEEHTQHEEQEEELGEQEGQPGQEEEQCSSSLTSSSPGGYARSQARVGEHSEHTGCEAGQGCRAADSPQGSGCGRLSAAARCEPGGRRGPQAQGGCSAQGQGQGQRLQCCAENGAPLHPQLLALAIAAGLCESDDSCLGSSPSPSAPPPPCEEQQPAPEGTCPAPAPLPSQPTSGHPAAPSTKASLVPDMALGVSCSPALPGLPGWLRPGPGLGYPSLLQGQPLLPLPHLMGLRGVGGSDVSQPPAIQV